MDIFGRSIDNTHIGVTEIEGDLELNGDINIKTNNNFVTTIAQSDNTVESWKLTLPVNPGVSGQVLSTDGTGVTSWTANAGGGGGGGDVFLNGQDNGATGVFIGSTSANEAGLLTSGVKRLTVSSGGGVLVNNDLTVGSGVQVRNNAGVTMYDTPDTNSVTLKVPSSVITSYDLVVPPEPGSLGQILGSSGGGVLEWLTPGSGSGDLINGGNSGSVTIGSTDNTTTYISGGANVFTTNVTGDITVIGDTSFTSPALFTGGNDLAFQNTSQTGIVSIRASESMSGIFGYKLPAVPPTNGQLLSSDNTGEMSWVNPSISNLINGGQPNGTATMGTVDNERVSIVQSNIERSFVTSNGTFHNDSLFFTDTIGNGVGFKAPVSVPTQYVYTLPSTGGANGQILSTGGAGADVPLSWIDIPSGASSTLQSNYNVSTSPQITTDATRGSLTIQRGSGADTDNVLEIKNGAGDTTLSVEGSGALIVTALGTKNTDPVLIVQNDTPTGVFGDAGLSLLGNNTIPARISLGDVDNSGGVIIKAPSAVTTGYELQLPNAQGGLNTTLVNDGNGVLSWGSSGGSPTDLGIVGAQGAMTAGIVFRDYNLDVGANATGTPTNSPVLSEGLIDVGIGNTFLTYSDAFFNVGDFTVRTTLVSKVTGIPTAGDSRIWSAFNSGTFNGLAMRINASGHVQLRLIPTATVYTFETGGSPSVFTATAQEEYQFELSVDVGGVTRLYINGVYFGSLPVSIPSQNATDRLVIGNSAPTSLNMYMKDFALFTELQHNTNANFTPTSLDTVIRSVGQVSATANGQVLDANVLLALRSENNNKTSLKANDQLTESYTLSLPSRPPTSGELMRVSSTYGTEVLEWASISSPIVTQDAQDNIVGGSGSGGSFSGTALRNLILGASSANNLSTGDDNLILGNNSATSLTTGSRNTVLNTVNGNASSSSDNVAIGFLSSIAFPNNSFGTAVGVSSQCGTNGLSLGYNARTPNGFSVLLGASTSCVGTYAVSIGYGASSTANQCVIGDDTGKITSILNGTENVCDIGASTRRFKDGHFNGTMNSSAFAGVYNNVTSTGTTDVITMNECRYVLISTTTTADLLSLGAGSFDGQLVDVKLLDTTDALDKVTISQTDAVGTNFASFTLYADTSRPQIAKLMWNETATRWVMLDFSQPTPHAYTSITTSAITDITVANTYVAMSGTFSTTEPSSLFTKSATGVLTYVGDSNITCRVNFTGSFSTATGASTVSLRLAKNNTPIVPSQVDRYLSNGDIGSISISVLIDLATNDTLQMFVTSDEPTRDPTFEHGQFSVVAI